MKNNVEDLGALPTGYHLYRKPNKVGGHIYYSDEIGGGVVVWDTCVVDESTLLTAIVCEKHRKYLEYMLNKGWKPSQDIENKRMAVNNKPFIDDKS